MSRSRRSRIRPTVATLAVATLAAVGAITGILPTTSAHAAPFVSPVENEGANCPVPALPGTGSLPTNARLPDPFRRLDGTRITSQADWRCHRELTLRMAEHYVFGAKPPAPQSVTGTVSRTSVTVNIAREGRSASFTATVDPPSGTGPFPYVIVLGGFGGDTATIKASGAAVVSFDPYAVGREGTARSNKQGAFYTLYGATSPTGLLMAWAWGVSRIIDVVEQSGGTILQADAVGVTGCSRFGKGAFVSGAFDQRIALTMPVESGTGGVPILRGVNAEGAQSLSSAYGEQPWLGDAFSAFTSSADRLPIDTHQLVGLVAPRGLFIMDNPHIAHLGPRSASVAALAGAEIYTALGVQENLTYWSDVASGTHCAARPEWRTPMQQNIQAFLFGSGSPSGTIRISSAAQGQLAPWVDWQTPNLGGGSTPPPTTPPPTGDCSVSVTRGQEWGDRFNVTLAVSGASDWTTTITLGSGQTLQNSWNASVTGTSGTLTARPNGSGNEFGITLFKNGNTALPTATCSASGTTPPPTTRPPTTPPPTTPPPTTPPPTTPPPTTPPPTTPPPTTPPPTTPPPSTGACSASASVNQWAGGFVATVRVTAGSAPVNGWTVTAGLPSGAAVSSAWGATASGTSGAVGFTNAVWNGSLPAGGATEFGFQGTGDGAGLTVNCASR